MAAGDDRLSALPDDLLRRVLYFVPAKEGALTSTLSRRWRPLWRSCGAVNLVVRARENDQSYFADEAFYAARDAFVSAAHGALDAAHQCAETDGHFPITKLTIRVEASRDEKILSFLHSDTDYGKHDVFAGLLSHPAARRVEELRIVAADAMYFEWSKYEPSPSIYGVGIYKLRLGSLPSATLRVLELTNCRDLSLAPSPQLMSLRLRHCNAPLKDLQRIIDAAPLLAFIHLEASLLDMGLRPSYNVENPPPEQGTLPSLRCPAVTELVLDKCCLKEEGTVEIYAPMLRHFRYQGVVRHISLSPPPPQLARAQLTFIEPGHRRGRDPRAVCQSFWGTVGGLSHAKDVKLRVRHLEELAITDDATPARVKLSNLESLELQGVYRPTGNAAAAVIASLLRCSPALCDLRLKLSTAHEETTSTTTKKAYHGAQFVEREHRSQFEESVRRFKSRRQQPTVAGDSHHDDDGFNYNEVSDLPGLSGQSFKCLRRCLRRVGLRFPREMAGCFGDQLVKFFAQNAMALETMFIDAGNERIHEHVNIQIEKWIAKSSNGTKVQVLPLAR